MVARAQDALQKALTDLKTEKLRIENEIRVVEKALTAIGIKSPNLAARKKRKPMTAAERRSVSKRMKAYWAKRKSKHAA
jgi:hypothetical protein